MDELLTDLLAKSIKEMTGTKGIEHDKDLNKSYYDIEKLECDIFHHSYFMDMLNHESQASARATMNFIMDKMTDKQLKVTSYIYAKSYYELTKRLVDRVVKSDVNPLSQEDIDRADVIADKIRRHIESIMSGIDKKTRESESLR